jgi:hypothetical protein
MNRSSEKRLKSFGFLQIAGRLAVPGDDTPPLPKAQGRGGEVNLESPPTRPTH